MLIKNSSKNGAYSIKSFSFNLMEDSDKSKLFYENKKDWLFGFLSYDLKNEVEDLNSTNFDNIELPNLHFFQPKIVIEFSEKEILSKDQKLELTFILNQSQKAYIKSGAVISFYPAIRLLDQAMAKFYNQTAQEHRGLLNSQVLEKQPFEVDKDNIIALQDYLENKKLSQG